MNDLYSPDTDELREKQIKHELDCMLFCKALGNHQGASVHWKNAADLIKGRSKAQVARMERERGLS